MASGLDLLMERLSALSDGGLREFWERYLLLEPSAPAPLRIDPEIAAISLVQSHGKQAVDVTRRILVDIDQNYLVQSLLDCRSKSKRMKVRRIKSFHVGLCEAAPPDVAVMFSQSEPHDDRLSALIHKVSQILSGP